AGDIPVYATQDVYSGSFRPQVDNDLNGIIFSESPWLLTNEDELRQQTQNLFPQNNPLLLRLQAFGVDAFRLYPRLKQLEDVTDSQIYGATGILRMDENRSIHQQYDWAQFVQGQAVPLEKLPL
ncbi:MAG: penicillin-binding protein activator, partial [Pseudohongiellaceae bacterium]